MTDVMSLRCMPHIFTNAHINTMQTCLHIYIHYTWKFIHTCVGFFK